MYYDRIVRFLYHNRIVSCIYIYYISIIITLFYGTILKIQMNSVTSNRSTLTYYPDSEPTSLCSYSIIMRSEQRSSKYQFYSLCLTRPESSIYPNRVEHTSHMALSGIYIEINRIERKQNRTGIPLAPVFSFIIYIPIKPVLVK